MSSIAPLESLASVVAEDFRGRPAVRFALPGGASCTVALHGGQLLSWVTADGVERFYLSPEAVFDGKTAIRGGVPICWPQFNQRGPLQKHGFARNVEWRVETPQAGTGADMLTLVLEESEATRAIWPHAFMLRLGITLGAQSLRVALTVTNTDAVAWHFSAALHSYLRVDDVLKASLVGLQGARRWDSLRDARFDETEASPTFGVEYDSVFAAPSRPLELKQPSGTLQITQSASCTETVVWNPGPQLCAKLADMPDDGWRHMLCVEAARIDEDVTLQPGETWEAWQLLESLDATAPPSA